MKKIIVSLLLFFLSFGLKAANPLSSILVPRRQENSQNELPKGLVVSGRFVLEEKPPTENKLAYLLAAVAAAKTKEDAPKGKKKKTQEQPVYKTKKNTQSQAKNQSGESKFKCIFSGCNDGFRFKKEWAAHLITHNPKPFACDKPECDYRARFKHALDRHLRKHTGERPFICDKPGCDYRAAEAYTLTKHIRTHTGERPYVCDWPECGYRAAQKSALNTHKIKHTGKRPFICDWPECGYRATQRSNLKTHMQTHLE